MHSHHFFAVSWPAFRSVGYFQELERMKKATPTLKYCRGEPFKEEHWSALLQVEMDSAGTHLVLHPTFVFEMSLAKL